MYLTIPIVSYTKFLCYQTLSQTNWSLQQKNVSVFKLVRKFKWLGCDKNHKGSKWWSAELGAYPSQQQSLKQQKHLLRAGLENWNPERSKYWKQASDGNWHTRSGEKGAKDSEKGQKKCVFLFWGIRSHVLPHLTIPGELKQEIYCLLVQMRPESNFITMLSSQASSLKTCRWAVPCLQDNPSCTFRVKQTCEACCRNMKTNWVCARTLKGW